MNTRPARERISAVMNTYNAEAYLPGVLESLKGFDEIVVVDMRSTDRTRDIAREYGAKIIDFEPCGICEPARNAAIQGGDNPWVLIVDADEEVPAALRDHLYDLISKADAPDALKIPRVNSFMGREMHCLYPDYVIRFAKKDRIWWPPVIHATPQVKGKVVAIPADRKDLALIHLEKNDVASRLEKLDRYTDQELKRRGCRRYGLPSYIFKPFGRFFRSFVLKGGWRDGRAGLLWGILEAQYKIATMARQEEAFNNKSHKDGLQD